MTRQTTSASNIFRRALCKGSHHAEAGRKNNDNPYSIEGTLLHKLDAEPNPEEEAKLTTEQRDTLAAGREGDDHIFRALHTSKQIDEHESFDEGNEREFWLKQGLRRFFPGHCDRWRYYPRLKILVIIDKKYGRGDVPAAEINLQLRSYAVMGADVFDCDHVLVAINQPRVRFEDRLSIAEYTRADITAARAELIQIWNDCQPEDAPRTASEEACLNCLAKVDCDAYREKYEWLEVPSHQGRDIFAGKLRSLTDDELDSVWRAITFAKRVEADAKEEILARKEAGGMPMYEVEDTGSTSTINDPVQALALLRTAGLSDQEIVACATFGKEKLAEKLHAKKRLPGIQAAKRELGKILTPCLTITKKKPSLMRIRNWQPAGVITDAPAPAADPAPSPTTPADDELFPK